MTNQETIFEKIFKWGLIILTFLLPLFFLPLTTNFYEFNKNLLLILATGLFVINFCLKAVKERKVAFGRTPFDLPLLLLVVAYFVSALTASPNRFMALISVGGPGTILALTLLFYLITSQFKKENRPLLINALIFSSSILSLLAIYQFIGLGALITKNSWLSAKNWTPAGSLLTLASVLTLSLPLALTKAAKKPKSLVNSIFASTAVFLIISALGISVYQMIAVAGSRPLLLPVGTGWQIAIEVLKNNPLFGVGPNEFLSAFTRFKPIGFNQTSLWDWRFATSSNWFFQVLSTLGLFGFGALIFLLWQIKKVFWTAGVKSDLSLKITLLLAFLWSLILPSNLPLLFLIYLFLAMLSFSLPRREYVEQSQILPLVLLFILLPVILASFFFMGKSFLADFYFKNSLEALVANRGVETYNLQIKAITTNPYYDGYRSAYSQTNFALANSIASDRDLSDQEREQVTILVQQAINEAKAAVSLNRFNVSNWENLASLYRSLTSFAQGAQDWSISAYQTAISLEPTNPNLRIALGGLFYGVQNWDEAIRNFEVATYLKPNLANAHYNLASALKEKGEYAKAATEMESVLALVPSDSGDFQKASSELEELRKKLGEKEKEKKEEAKNPESLTPPQSLPSPIEPPINLPEGSGPETAPTESPTPTPTLVPTTTP